MSFQVLSLNERGPPHTGAFPQSRMFRCEGCFVAAEGVQVLLERGEASAHGVEADVGGAKGLPALRLLEQGVEVAFPGVDLRFDAECCRVAARFLQVCAQAL